jgi:hypothetical protein
VQAGLNEGLRNRSRGARVAIVAIGVSVLTIALAV